jgi:hypothetical protein
MAGFVPAILVFHACRSLAHKPAASPHPAISNATGGHGSQRNTTLSLARLKRIAALEARRPAVVVWVDPYEAAMALKRRIEVDWPAVRDGRAEWIQHQGPPTEAVDSAMRRTLDELDRLAARLHEGRR